MSKCMVGFIHWYHDSLDGEERRKVATARTGDPHTHQIERVNPRHEGLYTCVVGNGKSVIRNRTLLVSIDTQYRIMSVGPLVRRLPYEVDLS